VNGGEISLTEFPEVGEIFDDQFKLLEVLFEDEYSAVFKANELDHERYVALKILNLDAANTDEFRKRLLYEAKALCRSRHKNVVRIFRIAVSESDLPYMVTELLKGRSVRKLLNANGTLPEQMSLAITARCADALWHAHNNGIVHRDLKPESIFVGGEFENIRVKLTDFGLAQLEILRHQSLTRTGILIGSASYMSPEQCMGQKADARSDIYALCACLYEMLTGKAPYNGRNEIALMSEHLSAPVPQIEESILNPSAQSVNKILSKGMAKEPERRYKNSAELLSDVEKILSSLTLVS
jgi:serine/threonine-protein kinase